MTMNLRDQILQAKDLPRESVNVPEWGNITVHVQTMTGTARDAFEQSCMKDGKRCIDNVRAKLLVNTLVDENGKAIFTQADVEALGAKSSKALDRLVVVAQRLNGVTDADVKELAKNS
jgi:hypothetical protein